MHGYLDHHADDTGFKIEFLSADQRANLVLLVESYFAAGYEWFTLWRFGRRNKSAWARVSEGPVPGEPNKLKLPSVAGGRIVFESLASSTHIAPNSAPWVLAPPPHADPLPSKGGYEGLRRRWSWATSQREVPHQAKRRYRSAFLRSTRSVA